ncbi:very short patch repair endonuclease [Geomonas sp. Red276]
MADIVSQEERSRIMSRIRGKNTKIEQVIRRGLFARGLRFRLHDSRLPGKPDLVFPRYRTVLFVNGCFWHGHDCSLFKRPSSNQEFWDAKIQKNRDNDRKKISLLVGTGWKVITVWECALRGKKDEDITVVLETVAKRIGKDFTEKISSIAGTAE